MNNILKNNLFVPLIIILSINTVGYSQYDDIKNTLPINPSNIDMSVDPNVDFYEYSNGNWLKNNPIPPEYSRWSGWDELILKNNEKLRIILEEAINGNAPKGSNLQKLGDLYFTAMDTVTIEQLGIDPLKDDLALIESIQNKDDFQKVFSYLKTFRSGGLFSISAGQDDRNSQNVILQVFQSGLGLPGRDYYLKDDDNSKDIRKKYTEYMAKLFTLTGTDQMTSMNITAKVMDMENRLAKVSMSRQEMRQAEATYHLMTLAELKTLTPNFSWDVLFNETGLNDHNKFDKGINVGQPEFLKEVDRMIADISVEDWKNYLKWNLIRWSADKLSSELADESFNFNSKVLRGTEQQQQRWKESLAFVNSAMGEPLGQKFAEKYFTPETKAKAMEMVSNIKESFAERIKNNEWMSEATKKEALKKLSKFSAKIGYTDEWKDYSGLDIDRSSFYNNMKKAAAYAVKLNLDNIAKPVKDEWFMLPQTVNASYNGSKNSITFPAGIMQPPFYDPDADDAVNYGGIGVIIGHEISHGFDDQGRKYDGDGNLRDWWTEDDAKKYTERAGKLAEQFSSYTAIDTFHVNGKLTLGENIADLGGMLAAYYALQKTLEGKEITLIDGFTPDQRFFLGFSQIWRENRRPESLKLLLNTDPHSPGRFRVIGTISNVEEFMKAFNGKPGDPMVNDAGERVVIW
ncbi:MAG: M13 family metallopeptidase [Ignavibacteria bacterium]|nr:M13 family metallopeptidase [Ignavibacteria bacterium]